MYRSAVSVLFLCLASVSTHAQPPNVVIIMADDVGWGDLGSYGGGEMRGAPTPHLDRMAAEGTRFTSFYAQPTCTPTRASLMTGRLPIRAGFTLPLFPGIPGGLHPDEVTIAELLEPAGYHSAVMGKWHLGEMDVNLPHTQGFDEFWGFLFHCDAYIYEADRDWPEGTPFAERWNIKGIVEAKKGGRSNEVEKIDAERLRTLDRDIAERSAAYIAERADDDAPFFLFTGFARAHYKNFPHPDFVGKSESGDYGDALMELDDNTGIVLDAIRDAGIAEKTLVLWMSDNGPSLDTFPDSGYTPFRGAKGEAYEGGVRMPCIAWWPGTVPAGRSTDGIMTTMDVFSTVAALAGVDTPTDRPIDGNDQSAFIKGEAPSATNVVYYYVQQHLMAIRNGKWKSHFRTVEHWPDGPLHEYTAPQLYDLKTDPKESKNLVYLKTWEALQASILMRQHLAEMARHPNRAMILAQ